MIRFGHPCASRARCGLDSSRASRLFPAQIKTPQVPVRCLKRAAQLLVLRFAGTTVPSGRVFAFASAQRCSPELPAPGEPRPGDSRFRGVAWAGAEGRAERFAWDTAWSPEGKGAKNIA